MTPINSIPAPFARRLALALAVLIAACLTGCATNSPDYANQMVFKQPEDAAKRLAAAVTNKDPAELEAIFGDDARQTLASGDPVADRMNREVVALAMHEQWTLETKDSRTRELVIGNEKWPFPIPLVKDGRGWWFDTAAGKQEIHARRIGRNELATIDTLRTYATAQHEYAAASRDGKPAGAFAQQIRSNPGEHNGLYWPSAGPKDMPSPLGELFAAASAEGYTTESKEGAAPFHGYFFRLLKAQGPAAPGGAKDYVVNGSMTGGFAMIAFPAMYRNSGVMTFLVGPDGVVYQADLGEDTATIAGGTTAYNPDRQWQVVR